MGTTEVKAVGVEVEDHDGWRVITLTGGVEMSNASALRNDLHRHLREANSRLILDLRALTHLDSTGLGLFVGLLKKARGDGGDVILVVNNPSLVSKMFQVTGIDRVFQVIGTVEEALAVRD